MLPPGPEATMPTIRHRGRIAGAIPKFIRRQHEVPDKHDRLYFPVRYLNLRYPPYPRRNELDEGHMVAVTMSPLLSLVPRYTLLIILELIALITLPRYDVKLHNLQLTPWIVIGLTFWLLALAYYFYLRWVTSVFLITCDGLQRRRGIYSPETVYNVVGADIDRVGERLRHPHWFWRNILHIGTIEIKLKTDEVHHLRNVGNYSLVKDLVVGAQYAATRDAHAARQAEEETLVTIRHLLRATQQANQLQALIGLHSNTLTPVEVDAILGEGQSQRLLSLKTTSAPHSPHRSEAALDHTRRVRPRLQQPPDQRPQ